MHTEIGLVSATARFEQQRDLRPSLRAVYRAPWVSRLMRLIQPKHQSVTPWIQMLDTQVEATTSRWTSWVTSVTRRV